MQYKYKLVMFGLSLKVESIVDVEKRLSQIPITRAKSEGIDQCYLIDLITGEKRQIFYDERKFFIEDNKASLDSIKNLG